MKLNPRQPFPLVLSQSLVLLGFNGMLNYIAFLDGLDEPSLLPKITIQCLDYHIFFVVLSLGRHRYLHLEIHCIALDGFDLNTVHKLSSKE